jgi:hypothetical protein
MPWWNRGCPRLAQRVSKIQTQPGNTAGQAGWHAICTMAHLIMNHAAFNAKFVSMSAVREYRVYARRSDFFFIEVPGLSATAEALSIHFGIIGLLVRRHLKKKARKKAELYFQAADLEDPEKLLGQNKHNFKVYVPEIRESSIEPPALFAMHGQQAGGWQFSMRDGKKMRFEFVNVDDMKAASTVLPQLLNGTLKVKAEWNETKKRFQKLKDRPKAGPE